MYALIADKLEILQIFELEHACGYFAQVVVVPQSELLQFIQCSNFGRKGSQPVIIQPKRFQLCQFADFCRQGIEMVCVQRQYFQMFELPNFCRNVFQLIKYQG